MWDWNKSFCLGSGGGEGVGVSAMLSSCPGGSLLWSRLQRVMKKQQLPSEMAPAGRIRTATQHCRPRASGGKPAGAWKPSLPLAGPANQELGGQPLLLCSDWWCEGQGPHEPRDFTCWTCLRQLVPQRSRSRVPPSRSSESCLSLSFLFAPGDPLGQLSAPCTWTAMEGVTDRMWQTECQRWEEAQLWLQPEFCSSQSALSMKKVRHTHTHMHMHKHVFCHSDFGVFSWFLEVAEKAWLPLFTPDWRWLQHCQQCLKLLSPRKITNGSISIPIGSESLNVVYLQHSISLKLWCLLHTLLGFALFDVLIGLPRWP